MKILKNSLAMPSFVILMFFLVSCSLPIIAPPKQENYERSIANSDIDTLLEEFRIHYEGKLSAERKLEVKTIQENLLKYLIEATSSSESQKIKIYQEASFYFNRVYPILLANIRNEEKGIKDFREIKKAPLWTLKEELRFLNDEAHTLPAPKIKVDLIQGISILAPLYKGVDSTSKEKLANEYGVTVKKMMGEDFNLHPNFLEMEDLLTSEDSEEEKILKIVGLVESKVKKHEERIRNIGTEIASSGQLDLKNGQIRMAVKFMDYYFTKMPDDVIKTILSEFVNSGAKLTREEVLRIVFQNTGPGLGKLLQQIGKEKGVGEEFSKMMAVLESSGKEVPIHLVEEVVKKDTGGFEVRKLEPKPLGTGTIAQVNRAQIWQDEKEVDVALRFLKPGVEKRCKEDIKILRQFVPDNEAVLLKEGFQDNKIMTTLIDSVEKFLDEEVDLSMAVEKQKKAYEIYSRSIKISEGKKFDLIEMHVPQVYLPPNGNSNLHVQEFASGGVKFAKLTDDATKKIVAQEMVRMWFEEALFKSGFLNADLHQGNFRVVLIEENSKIKILLYDFGLSSTLSKEEQRAFLLLGAGAYLKSPERLTDGLMVSMNSTDPKMRAKLIADIVEEMKVRPNKKPEEWVVWCVQKNYFVSDNLGAFARGSLLLKQLPESIGQTEMFKETIVKTALKNLGRAIADRDYNYPLTKIDLVKIAIEGMKSRCQDIFRQFFISH